MGSALGSVLARSPVPMKEWGSYPDEQLGRPLQIEALVVGSLVMASYMLLLYAFAQMLYHATEFFISLLSGG
ncbi:hypothetical protein J3454_15520 [Erythrobacter sp. NFXS35]|uniref:hypothetical protein n=1 Tax=Erythrobacter sp. NFXS35 TaxID=2818436 RepID=UPI0032DF85E2